MNSHWLRTFDGSRKLSTTICAAILSLMAVLTMLPGVVFAEEIPRSIGVGHDAQWSPDEKYISLVRNDSLLAVRVDSIDRIELMLFASVYRYEWIASTEIAVQTRRYYPHTGGKIRVEEIIRCRVGERPELIAFDSVALTPTASSKQLHLSRFSDGSVGYTSEETSGKTTTMLSPNAQIPSSSRGRYVWNDPQPDGPIWLYYAGGAARRIVVAESGQYILPQLAPSMDKILCHNNNGDMVVFDTVGVLLSNLGRVSMPRWDATGRWIIYCDATWGHYDLISSDLAIVRFDGSDRRRLTNSTEVEEEPAISPSGTRVLYRDNKSGAILVIDLN